MSLARFFSIGSTDKKQEAAAPVLGTRPHYVAMIPVKVDSDSEADTSDGEEGDTRPGSLVGFGRHYFEHPEQHFRLWPHPEEVPEDESWAPKRGAIVRPEVSASATAAPLASAGAASAQLDLLGILAGEAFDDATSAGSGDDLPRLAVSLGLNKMRSLSRSRNSALTRELTRPLDTRLTVRRAGLYWDGVWQESRDGRTWHPVSYGVVRAFYRQLKQRDAAKARAFRAAVEKRRSHMVPMRELREEIKNHSNTPLLVKRHREKADCKDVYLAVMDSDMQRSHKKVRGIFSVYDALIAEHATQPLEAASTGYAVQGDPMICFAVELDMLIRSRTAAVIKFGVYYPEPSSIVRVRPDKSTVTETFTIEDDKHYHAPQEMPILLKGMVRNRGLDPQTSFAFNTEGAVKTSIPARMNNDFSARFNRDNKLIHWRLDDFKQLRNISQSHYDPLSWAKNVLKAFVIPARARVVFPNGIDSIELLKGDLDKFLASIISRIFSAYDPVMIARIRQSKTLGFHESLTQVLADYLHVSPKLATATRKEKAGARLSIALGHHDKVTEMEGLVRVLQSILDQAPENTLKATDIQRAAESCGQGIAELLSAKLCLNPLELVSESMAELLRYFADIHGSGLAVTELNLKPLFIRVIDSTITDARAGSSELMRQATETLGPYDTRLLHWAAMTGHQETLIWLLSKDPDQVGGIEKPAVLGMLPIHCAIFHCAQNGNNLSLLELLCNDAVIARDFGKSLFRLATDTCVQPFSIIDFLFKKYKALIEVHIKSEYFAEHQLLKLLIAAVEADSDLKDILLGFVEVGDVCKTLEILIATETLAVSDNIVAFAVEIKCDISEVVGRMEESVRVAFCKKHNFTDLLEPEDFAL